VGHFPAPWVEWNGKFRDELRVELKARYRDATDAVMVRLTADVGRALGSSASGSSGFVPANAGAE